MCSFPSGTTPRKEAELHMDPRKPAPMCSFAYTSPTENGASCVGGLRPYNPVRLSSPQLRASCITIRNHIPAVELDNFHLKIFVFFHFHSPLLCYVSLCCL